jgi:DtxR family Mn-dependent transcriptional regulator
VNTPEQLSESLENYVEAIFHIETKKHAARAKDIAERLKVSNSSVTGALRLLSEKGLVNYAPYDIITLTSKGKAIARDVVHRHTTLRDFFVKILSIDEPDAEEAACKMEHGVSPIVLNRLTQFIEFLETCPQGSFQWLEKFNAYCEHGNLPAHCQECRAQGIEDMQPHWANKSK